MTPRLVERPDGFLRIPPKLRPWAWRRLDHLDNLIPLAEAARRSGYSVSGLYYQIRKQRIWAVRFRGRWWVHWPLLRPVDR